MLLKFKSLLFKPVLEHVKMHVSRTQFMSKISGKYYFLKWCDLKLDTGTLINAYLKRFEFDSRISNGLVKISALYLVKLDELTSVLPLQGIHVYQDINHTRAKFNAEILDRALMAPNTVHSCMQNPTLNIGEQSDHSALQCLPFCQKSSFINDIE